MKVAFVIMLISPSQMLYAQETIVVQQDTESINQDQQNQTINLVFDNVLKDRTTGSISLIDTESSFLTDSRRDLSATINGKVAGVLDTYNFWGTGGAAVVLVDGVRQNLFYANQLNILEIESIVILKDAVSKALYGAQGDRGVILINTKRGQPGTNKIRISAEQSISAPRALPNFLNSADYMEKYNEALINDGFDPIYTQDVINGTRTGNNPTLYPDNDFYSTDYIREMRTNFNVIADMSGGDENAQYYVNTELRQDNGWLNTSIPDVTNSINFRGNLDFKINDFMKMGVDAVTRLNFAESPNLSTDYWESFATILPNAYPALWDPSLLQNEELQETVSEANLVDGQLLGGTSSFADNQIYGELTQNGRIKFQERIVQFGTKLDVDMGFLTEGLAAKGYIGMNYYNTLFTSQNPTYAIYEPVFDSLNTLDSVIVHGIDEERNQFNTDAGASTFYRQMTYHGSLRYNRNFGRHDISAIGLWYGDLITSEDLIQKDVLFHVGFSANYMYDKRYVLEGSLMRIGSRKLSSDRNMEFAPSAGLAWILSEEAFMSDLPFVDYLKLRASYGISKNDNWGTANNLWNDTFIINGTFNYNNGTNSNVGTSYFTVGNDISFQKRRDISVGLSTTMFDKKLNLEVGYFNSESFDNITIMEFTYPQLVGYEDLLVSNYNSDKTTGIELGINYSHELSEDFSTTIGTNLTYRNPKITKIDEPSYDGVNAALTREGTARDAIWALVDNGLYSESDFSNGELAAGLPIPTWGSVQPGDIKYIDQNGDGIIDQLDQRIVGHGIRTQYSVFLDLRYRNFGFYVLGIGRLGDSNTRNDSDDGEGYFQVQGNIKYSEYALQAYGPNNQNVNALHPRLTTISGGNNDRNSSFWIYENNSFVLPTMQLTYRFTGQNKLSFLKQGSVYLRSSNLVVLGKNKEYTEVNPYGAPFVRSFVLGLVTTF